MRASARPSGEKRLRHARSRVNSMVRVGPSPPVRDRTVQHLAMVRLIEISDSIISAGDLVASLWDTGGDGPSKYLGQQATRVAYLACGRVRDRRCGAARLARHRATRSGAGGSIVRRRRCAIRQLHRADSRKAMRALQDGRLHRTASVARERCSRCSRGYIGIDFRRAKGRLYHSARRTAAADRAAVALISNPRRVSARACLASSQNVPVEETALRSQNRVALRSVGPIINEVRRSASALSVHLKALGSGATSVSKSPKADVELCVSIVPLRAINRLSDMDGGDLVGLKKVACRPRKPKNILLRCAANRRQ